LTLIGACGNPERVRRRRSVIGQLIDSLMLCLLRERYAASRRGGKGAEEQRNDDPEGLCAGLHKDSTRFVRESESL
jgi:hypothetical protein